MALRAGEDGEERRVCTVMGQRGRPQGPGSCSEPPCPGAAHHNRLWYLGEDVQVHQHSNAGGWGPSWGWVLEPGAGSHPEQVHWKIRFNQRLQWIAQGSVTRPGCWGTLGEQSPSCIFSIPFLQTSVVVWPFSDSPGGAISQCLQLHRNESLRWGSVPVH